MKTLSGLLSRTGAWLIFITLLLAVTGFWIVLASQPSHPTGSAIAPAARATSVSGYPGPETATPPQPPRRTPTRLPASKIHLGPIENLKNKSSELDFQPAETPRFIAPATNGEVLVGVEVYGPQKLFGRVVTIDLDSGKVTPVAEVMDVAAPQISDTHIVWADQGRLQVYDRVTRKLSTLAVTGLARDFSLWGSTLVWENIEQGQTTGIMGWDLSTSKTWEVVKSTAEFKAYRPQVSGEWVIYERWGLEDGEPIKELSVIPLTGGEGIVLDRLPNMMGHTPPLYALGAPWAVWADWGEKPGLKLYNFETGEKQTVTPPDCRQDGFTGQPSHFLVSETMILFQGCYQSLGYSLTDGEFFSVPLNEGAESSGLVGWAFAHDQLVWAHMQSGPGARQTSLYSARLIRDK
jgi:hypothetical protein